MFTNTTKPLIITESQKELLKNMEPTDPAPKRPKTNRAVADKMRVLKEMGLLK